MAKLRSLARGAAWLPDVGTTLGFRPDHDDARADGTRSTPKGDIEAGKLRLLSPGPDAGRASPRR